MCSQLVRTTGRINTRLIRSFNKSNSKFCLNDTCVRLCGASASCRAGNIFSTGYFSLKIGIATKNRATFLTKSVGGCANTRNVVTPRLNRISFLGVNRRNVPKSGAGTCLRAVSPYVIFRAKRCSILPSSAVSRLTDLKTRCTYSGSMIGTKRHTCIIDLSPRNFTSGMDLRANHLCCSDTGNSCLCCGGNIPTTTSK